MKNQHVMILTKEVKIHKSHVEMKKGPCDTWIGINGWISSFIVIS